MENLFSQTHVQLCEFSVLTQLGSDLTSIVRVLARCGPMPLNALVTRLNEVS